MIIKHPIKISLLLFLTFTSLVVCQENRKYPKQTISIQHINEPIEINGKLDNPAWLKAQTVELKYELFPGDNTPAPQKTYVRMLYDDENIYVGFQCLDSNPEEIRANISDRDKIFNDDNVLLILETYGDYQRSFEFLVNPYGIQADMLGTINSEDASVDFIWYSEASINDEGWTAEMAIPFSSLSFPDKEDPVWTLGLFRNIPRSSPVQVCWTPFDRNMPGFFVKQLGYLTGLKNINSSSNIEFLPYVVGQKSGNLSNPNDQTSGINFGSIKGRIGGGIKYSPTPEVSIDAVINPDFSQVESDADQISVNTTFALYYNEKRPFFLVGTDLLESSMYYSRSINDPLAAARVIGKSGSLSYLYLSAYDRNTIIVVPGEEQSNTVASSLKSFANIARLRYEFGNESYIGGMVLTRNFSDAHNFLLGFDWKYKFQENWFFNGEGFYSQTKEPNNTNLFNSSRKFGSTGYDAAFNGENYSGIGLHSSLSYYSRSYNFDFIVNNYSPTYQTYNGLFTFVGYRQIIIDQRYVYFPENSFIDRGSVGITSDIAFNFDGIKKDQAVKPYISFNLKGQTYFYASYLFYDETFSGKQFKNLSRASFNIQTQPLSQLTFSLYAQVGKFIYRSNSPRIGKGHNLNAELTLKPTSQLNVAFSYARARLSSQETGELFYDGNIYRSQLIYQLSAQMFIRTIAQYNSFNKSLQVYPLFSFKLNAFTTFYAGATSSYLDYGTNLGFTNTEQQYFMKFQYLL